MYNSKISDYESYLVLIICFFLTIILIYAVSNMINLIDLNKYYDNKLLDYKVIYEKQKQIIETQNNEYSKLIENLKHKHKQFLKFIKGKYINKEKKNQDSSKYTEDIDKYFNKKIIPSVKTILKTSPIEDYNFENELHMNNRWSYI